MLSFEYKSFSLFELARTVQERTPTRRNEWQTVIKKQSSIEQGIKLLEYFLQITYAPIIRIQNMQSY